MVALGNKIKLTVVIPVYNQEKLIIKALESIPKRKDVEIIICNDGSKDNTEKSVLDFIEKNNEYFYNITYLLNEENQGVGYTINRCYDTAKGEYIVALGSDDYFFTEEFNKVIDELDGKSDMVYFNMIDNNNYLYELNKKTKLTFVGSVKCIKRTFLSKTRGEPLRVAEDRNLANKLYKKNPKEKFTNILAKYYNYPRINSLCYNDFRSKKDKELISIIIPAKDRAESTKRLLNELILQKEKYYPETEIIVVENGSEEDMSFLDEYKDIIVCHETEAGLSHARNIGLDIAVGKYVCFIDNDDFVSRDYLHQLYTTMRKQKCDWCAFKWKLDGKEIDGLTIDPKNPLKDSWSTCCYCFTRKIIKDTKFNEKLNVGEDIDWMPRVITKDTKGIVLNSYLYDYTWEGNENSLSHRFNRGELSKEREE